MSTSEESTTESRMFGPLTFETVNRLEAPNEVSCLRCNDTFKLPLDLPNFVKHLFDSHNIVIEDVQKIENLENYVNYWREKFKSASMEEIIPTVKVQNSNGIYFVLSDLLKEDKELRSRIRLEHALKIQEFERSDKNYQRMCLFCKLNFEGLRTDFVKHLEEQHNLQLGDPQNLVFIEELIEKIDYNLKELICIYCQRVFPERTILKEHMRKKLHKRLNWNNKDYDKFFIINYLDSKEKKKVEKELNKISCLSINNDEDFSDWNETDDSINCLFCDKKENDINTLCLHMEADHEFDFIDLTKFFSFYQKIKFVNYVRRQNYEKKCFYCNLKFNNHNELRDHLFKCEHCKIPDIKIFDQPEYYFPTYENDSFLYFIDDVED